MEENKNSKTNLNLENNNSNNDNNNFLITSSPGKILLSGGYLVINPNYQGLVLWVKTISNAKEKFLKNCCSRSFKLYCKSILKPLCTSLRPRASWGDKNDVTKLNEKGHISEHYFLDEFVCIRKLIDHKGEYFW